MTVDEELRNRGYCRLRLAGVLVAVDGEGASVPVDGSHWDPDGCLVLKLPGGFEVDADRCHLRSRWPVACRPPRRRNEWNSAGEKWAG